MMSMLDMWQIDQSIFERSTREAFSDTWAVVSMPPTLDPALLYARLADLTRSNALLWTETGLQMQERTTRGVAAGRAVSRPLVLAAVAADISMGYAILDERARWFPTSVESLDRRWQDERGAQRVVDTASTLGGALIKACQFASTRPDLLPAAYIRALAPLQDRMPPRPWREMKAAIESEVGQPLEAIFEEIEEEPVAAASIGQVHHARLRPQYARDMRYVAAKIQYPDIRDLVATDLAALQRLVTLISRISPSIRLQPILDYLKETLPLEVDFAHEAKAMIELREALHNRADVAIPKVVPELSTERLIVMEYLEGIKITDRAALEEAGVDLRVVARLLNEVYADQILRHGILHADPHPGNLLVQPGSPGSPHYSGPRLVLLDHGLTVLLAPALVASLRKMVQALARGDFAMLTQALKDAGVQLDEALDLEGLLGLVGVLLGNAPVQDAETVEVAPREGPSSTRAQAGMRLSKSIGDIPVELLLVGRALGLLDGITKQLDPQINTIDIISNYA